jgi:hypothetical protein
MTELLSLFSDVNVYDGCRYALISQLFLPFSSSRDTVKEYNSFTNAILSFYSCLEEVLERESRARV